MCGKSIIRSRLCINNLRSPYQVLSTYTVNEHTFQKANNSQKKFFIGLMKYSNLLIVNWWVFVKCEPKSSQLKEPKT